MTATDFANLYVKQSEDEKITPYEDGIGFSIVRNYAPNTKYYKDGMKMFFHLRLKNDNSVAGSLDMVKEDKEYGGKYTIIMDDDYKKGTTGIDYFGNDDGFLFQSETKKIFYASENKNFTINEFVDLLVKNHLSDRLFWKRKNDYAISVFLKYFFWLSDKNYDRIQVMLDRHRPEQEKKYNKGDEKNIEPFFKYFYISKNILFSSLFIGFFASLLIPFLFCIEDFSLSNPTIILFFFLVLFLLEKISVWMNNKIEQFFKGRNNFISESMDYLYKNSFRIKIF